MRVLSVSFSHSSRQHACPTNNNCRKRSRRRRCQRIPPDSAICALCQKHNVPCVPSALSTSGTKSARTRGSSFSTAAKPTSSTAPSNAVAPLSLVDGDSPYAASLPQTTTLQASVTSPSVTDHGTPTDTPLPPAAVCFHLATLYFDYVHDQLHTLFQKPAFMADMVMNKTPAVIMYAVIALSARSVIIPFTPYDKA